MIGAWLKREWSQVSTKVGTVLLLVSSAIAEVAPSYAQFDRRIAMAGAIAGVLSIAWRGRASA